MYGSNICLLFKKKTQTLKTELHSTLFGLKMFIWWSQKYFNKKNKILTVFFLNVSSVYLLTTYKHLYTVISLSKYNWKSFLFYRK